jgi:hypothetical protein
MYQNELDGTKYEPGTCAEADRAVNGRAKCTACPFPACIYSLKGREKQLVMSAPVVRKVYETYDQVQDIKTVASALGMSYDKVHRWLNERPRIEKKLRMYALV